MIKLAIASPFIKSLSVLGGTSIQPVSGVGEGWAVCASLSCVPDIKARELMRVAVAFLTQCGLPVGNFRRYLGVKKKVF